MDQHKTLCQDPVLILFDRDAITQLQAYSCWCVRVMSYTELTYTQCRRWELARPRKREQSCSVLTQCHKRRELAGPLHRGVFTQCQTHTANEGAVAETRESSKATCNHCYRLPRLNSWLPTSSRAPCPHPAMPYKCPPHITNILKYYRPVQL